MKALLLEYNSSNNIVVEWRHLSTINSTSITTKIRICNFKQISILIIKWLVWISIIPIISPNPEILVRSIHSHLNNEISSCRNFHHISFKHDWEYLSSLINFSTHDFHFKLITWSILNNILISNKERLLSRSKPINSKTCNHNWSIWSPSNSIPWCLWVTPTTRWHYLKPEESMHIPLSLQTE